MPRADPSPDDPRDSKYDRTDLAEDRNILAIERTYAAWLRTGLGALAVGIAFERLFFETQPVWISKAGATALIVLAVVMFLFSLWRYRQERRRVLHHSVPRMPIVAPAIMAVLGSCSAVVAALVFWLL